MGTRIGISGTLADVAVVPVVAVIVGFLLLFKSRNANRPGSLITTKQNNNKGVTDNLVCLVDQS